MCARRKEQSDGIAIVTKSIASCVPARRALPNGRRGKHVRKGDMHLICSHSLISLAKGQYNCRKAISSVKKAKGYEEGLVDLGHHRNRQLADFFF